MGGVMLVSKLIDLTGQRFGELVVIGDRHVEKNGNKYTSFWKCRCDCGTVKYIRTTHLRSGRVKSCGNHAKDYTGQRIGRLLVLERAENGRDGSGRSFKRWKCLCDCGNITYVSQSNLGVHTTSCGCYLKEVAGKQTLKHGYRKTRLYRIYNGMKQRCNNPNIQEYKNYGGRGIKVCDAWNRPDGLKEFAEWALSHGYQEDLTIERIDVNGDYSPENCKWIPQSEQGKNTTKNVFVTYNGEKMIIADFSRKTGIDHRIVSRDLKNGLTIDEIVARYSK